MATAVTAYKQSLGFDSPPYTYQDFSESDVLVFVGANPCIAHPIMWERVCHNQNNPAIIVVDPRHTETAMAASHHLPIAPKSDLTLFYAVARELIQREAIDRSFIDSHTNDFAAFAQHVAPFTLEHASQQTGLSVEQIAQFATLIENGKCVSFWWTMGVNQSYEGTRVAQSLINLALMTRNIGRPGTGANSITGQCNAMGSRLFSNTTNLLGGHDFSKLEDRQKVAAILDLDVDSIPTVASLPYHQILEQVEAGTIKALWVICTNPAHSWSHRGRLRRILDKLDFLVVQDMYHDTETARHADLFLPAAGWGEKDGTFINSERRIGRIRKVRRAPGQALADFQIFRLLAQHWGCADLLPHWRKPEDTFHSLCELTRGQPCDISGIANYAALDAEGGIQWPRPAAAANCAQQRRLFSDGRFFHPDGRAKFVFSPVSDNPEAPSEDFPFVLLTGRGTASQWHTQTRTRNSAVLRSLYPQTAYVEMHPDDAASLGVATGDGVRLRSPRGQASVRVVLTPTVQPSQLFMPMHYAETNELTQSVFDPYSHQPSYRASAVSVSPSRCFS